MGRDLFNYFFSKQIVPTGIKVILLFTYELSRKKIKKKKTNPDE
jgi:hypothetical protein